MLKRTCVLITMSLILALPLWLGAQEVTEGSPKLEIQEKILDFGKVAQGDEIIAEFKIDNTGTAPLQVKTVRPTCGCTVADYPASVEAGQTGIIKATVDTLKLSGPVSKALLLVTDDPENPSSSLVIKADIRPYLEVLPRPIVRFNALQHEEAEQKVVLVSSDESTDDFEITKIEADVPYIECTSRLLEKNEKIEVQSQKQYEILIKLTKEVPVGSFPAKVTVHTSHPKAPKVQFNVFGVIRALLHVAPPRLQFGTIEAQLKPGRNLAVVNNREDADVKITGVEVADPAFEAQYYQVEPGKRYQVTVTIKPDAEPGVRDTVLTIHTDDPEFPEVKVPVRANIR